MKVTLLGHASVLVELPAQRILIDPVLDDPFGEGAVASCPSRRVRRERLPSIELVVLTSALPDRFDVATLAKLSRASTVVCVDVPTLRHALGKLGFRKVKAIAPNTIVKHGGVELWATPSERGVVEVGVLIKAPSGVFWHQADTVAGPALVQQVRAWCGRVDLLATSQIAAQPAYLGTAREGFPMHAVQAAVARMRLVAPKLVVPASGGMRYVGPFAWANRFLFPVSRERLLGELARGAPELAATLGDPGDVFELTAGAPRRHPGASPIASMLADDTDAIEFDPTAAVPPLADPNLDGYPAEVLDQAVRGAFGALEAFVRGAYGSDDPLLQWHRRTRTSYRLGVVFPDGEERWLRIHFDDEAPRFEARDGQARSAQCTHRLAASVLTAWSRCERSYHFLGGLSRRSRTLGAALVNDDVTIDTAESPDLMLYVLDRELGGTAARELRHLDFRLASLTAPPRA